MRKLEEVPRELITQHITPYLTPVERARTRRVSKQFSRYTMGGQVTFEEITSSIRTVADLKEDLPLLIRLVADERGDYNALLELVTSLGTAEALRLTGPLFDRMREQEAEMERHTVNNFRRVVEQGSLDLNLLGPILKGIIDEAYMDYRDVLFLIKKVGEERGVPVEEEFRRHLPLLMDLLEHEIENSVNRGGHVIGEVDKFIDTAGVKYLKYLLPLFERIAQ